MSELLTIDLAVWSALTRGWSAEAKSLALAVTIHCQRAGITRLPYPDMFTLEEWQHESGVGNARSLWPSVATALVEHEGHYTLPWFKVTKRSHTEQTAAWRAWALKPPLSEDRMLCRAWVEFHEMRQLLKMKPWMDRTCETWLGKELQKYGRDVMILTLELSTANQWQGLFPEKAMHDAKLSGRHGKPVNGRAKEKIQDWLRRRERQIYGESRGGSSGRAVDGGGVSGPPRVGQRRQAGPMDGGV